MIGSNFKPFRKVWSGVCFFNLLSVAQPVLLNIKGYYVWRVFEFNFMVAEVTIDILYVSILGDPTENSWMRRNTTAVSFQGYSLVQSLPKSNQNHC